MSLLSKKLASSVQSSCINRLTLNGQNQSCDTIALKRRFALKNFKINIHYNNNQGETPLFVAIRNNQLACVQQLLNAGTRLSCVDNRGGSALHIAAKMGNVTVVDMLLTNSESEEKNIDINRCDNIGYTPVYYAINASRYIYIY